MCFFAVCAYWCVPRCMARHLSPDMQALVEGRTCAGINRASHSRYFKANIVYLLYATIMLTLDVFAFSDSFETMMYFILAILHVINAYMYLWMWSGEHQNIYSIFCIPDWLNVICAAFYIGTSICHPFEYDEFGNTTEIFVQVRRIELFLSVLEILTAAGYVGQWYLEYRKDLLLHPEKCKSRGFTFDDPDMWANVTLVVAAIYYFAYNVIVCMDGFKYYNTSTLYFQGDAWYLINSVCYLLCSLRDWDVFWFMPSGGQFPNYSLLASEYARGVATLESHSVAAYRDDCLQGLTGEARPFLSMDTAEAASLNLGDDVEMGPPRIRSSSASNSNSNSNRNEISSTTNIGIIRSVSSGRIISANDVLSSRIAARVGGESDKLYSSNSSSNSSGNRNNNNYNEEDEEEDAEDAINRMADDAPLLTPVQSSNTNTSTVVARKASKGS